MGAKFTHNRNIENVEAVDALSLQRTKNGS